MAVNRYAVDQFIVGRTALLTTVGSLLAASQVYKRLRYFSCSRELSSQIVSPLKDVEGLHFKFHYNLYHKYDCHTL